MRALLSPLGLPVLCGAREKGLFHRMYTRDADWRRISKEGRPPMLDQLFFEVYTKFKLHFYQAVLMRFQSREASLTTVETFCMECIQALGTPTINEFASFLHISAPNAAYKVNSLVKKGYVKRTQSRSDKREYHLQVTQKYVDYYNISTAYLKDVVGRIKETFSPEDSAKLEEMLRIISRELMADVELPIPPEDGK